MKSAVFQRPWRAVVPDFSAVALKVLRLMNAIAGSGVRAEAVRCIAPDRRPLKRHEYENQEALHAYHFVRRNLHG